MTIKTNRTDLPRSAAREVTAPDEHPRFVSALAGAFMEQYLADGNDERPTTNGSLLRGSDAGSCGRQLAYEMRRRRGDEGFERTNPMTIADFWRLGLGSIIHDRMERPIKGAFPGAEVEVVAMFEEPDLSLHADLLVEHEGRRVLVELKTVGGFAFKQQIGGEGPRLSATLQGALAALALDCDEMVVGILALELLSPAAARKAGRDEVGRFAAEWTLQREEFEPLARAELARLSAIEADLAADVLSPRSIPGLTPLGAEVVDPATGRWELRDPTNDFILNSGGAWACGYCSWQARCGADKAAGR